MNSAPFPALRMPGRGRCPDRGFEFAAGPPSTVSASRGSRHRPNPGDKHSRSFVRGHWFEPPDQRAGNPDPAQTSIICGRHPAGLGVISKAIRATAAFKDHLGHGRPILIMKWPVRVTFTTWPVRAYRTSPHFPPCTISCGYGRRSTGPTHPEPNNLLTTSASRTSIGARLATNTSIPVERICVGVETPHSAHS